MALTALLTAFALVLRATIIWKRSKSPSPFCKEPHKQKAIKTRAPEVKTFTPHTTVVQHTRRELKLHTHTHLGHECAQHKRYVRASTLGSEHACERMCKAFGRLRETLRSYASASMQGVCGNACGRMRQQALYKLHVKSGNRHTYKSLMNAIILTKPLKCILLTKPRNARGACSADDVGLDYTAANLVD